MKKIFIIVFLLMICFLIKDNQSVESTSMESYCYVPPTIGINVSPNLLLVIDLSGSMSWCAYNTATNRRDCCDTDTGCGWTFRGNEEGYFIPNKIYRYNSTAGYWEETTGTAATCPRRSRDINRSNMYQGACLNFIYMRRTDLLRWALTGGKPNSCDSNNIYRCNPEVYPHPQLSCDSYGCILRSDSGERVRVPWDRITGTNGGLLFQLKRFSIKPRIGVMFFSGTGVRANKVYIGDFTSSASFDASNPYKNTITLINYESASGTTPIAPALWDAYNYFSQQSQRYGGFQPSSGADYWRNPLYQCMDVNNDGNCQGSELQPVPCAKNFIILLTDGQWNTGGPPGNVTSACRIDVGYGENGLWSADPVVPAYWLHKRGFTNPVDNRTSTYYIDTLYGIGMWLGGTGEQSLKIVSIYGSFDRSKSWPDNLSDYPWNQCSPIDDCCSTSNCGRGSPCAPLPLSTPDWDKNGDNKPDTFFSASDAVEIKDSLLNALYDILRKASSGATVATLSSQTGFSSVLIQPFYYPRYLTNELTELSWLGFLRSMWVDLRQNIREDTVTNKILDILGSAFDKIIKFITVGIETKVAVLQGDSEVGTNPCTRETERRLEEIKSVFDSSCWLCDINPNSRNIKYNSGTGLAEFTTTAASSIRPVWQAIDSSIDTDQKAACVVRYLRGENLSNDPNCSTLPNVKRLRELNLTQNQICPGYTGLKTWKLGDIIHSTPAVVSNQPVNIYHKKYGDSSYAEFINSDHYKNRPSLIFVGANDGMLHAFRIGTIVNQASFSQPSRVQNAPGTTADATGTDKVGREEWAFIPKNALPYLVWYGKQEFINCHVPTVDYRPFIFDAKVSGQWRTLLLGVMGFGGKAIPETTPNYSSSIFVLDITDPLNPSLLWERSLDDRTLTLSFPAVVKIGDNWYIVAGTGPKDPQGTQFTTAKIYFFNLHDGTDARSPITVETGINAAVGDLMVTDADLDYSDDAIYFGTYTLNSGNFYRLIIKNGLANATLSRAVTVGAPIFAAPTFTKDEENDFWVFFGTGRYLTDSDRTIGYTNYLIGFKDPCWNGSCNTTYTLGNFVNTTNLTVYATITEIKKVCICDASNCGLVNVVYKTNPVTNYDEVSRGWYITLTSSPREAIFSQPFIFGNTLDALSFEPSNDICTPGGITKLLSLHYKSGTADPRPAVYSPLAVQGTIAIGENVIVKPKISLGYGSPPLGNPFQTAPTAGQEIKKFVQLSGGIVIELPQVGGLGGRFISWIEK